jgi:type VI protein secretion system component VasF
VATAATFVLLSGCGGSSSSSSSSSALVSSSSTSQASQTSQTSQTSQSAGQFKAAIAPVLNQFKSASQATGAALQQANTQNDAQVAATFQQLAGEWKSALTKLETLQPPPQFTAAYNRLRSQVRRVKADLAAIASAAQTHDATAAKHAVTKLVNDIVSAKATSTTLSNGAP